MPFEMAYDDDAGGSHPDSYWLIKFLSLNDPNQTGTVVLFGYHDSASFDAGMVHIGEHRYDFTTPSEYELALGQGRYPLTDAYFQQVEERVAGLDTFFDLAEYLSAVKVVSVEVGPEGVSKVVVTFAVEVNGADLEDGATIKINGVAATITGAVKTSAAVIAYTVTETVGPTDVVTWEYDHAAGSLEDNGSARLQSFTPQTAANSIGGYLWFDDASNSIWLAAV